MSSSTPIYTPAPYSDNVSSHSTNQPRDDPSNTQEHEDSSNSESEQEVPPTTVLPRPTPTIVQPPTGGLRIRQTARKRVAIPRRVTLTTPRPEAPEPLRVVPDVPIGRMTEPSTARDQHIRAMTTELHGCQVRVTHQGLVLTELVELTHQLTLISSQAREGAKMARQMASRAQATSLVMGLVLLLLVFLFVIGAYLG